MLSAPLRVLLIEDNPADARLVRKALELDIDQRIDLTWVQLLADGLEMLRSSNVDAILLDMSLPDCQGLSCLDQIQQRAPTLPVVILTGTEDEEAAFEAVRRGAQDYIFKSSLAQHALARTLQYSRDRQALKHQLAKRADEVERLLNALPDPVIVVDKSGRLLSWNQQLERASGFSPSELGRFRVEDLVTATGLSGLRDAFDVAASDNNGNADAELRTKQGTSIPFSWTTSSLRHEGQQAALIGVGRNLSDRKAAEAAHEKQQLAEYRARFIHMIAHELRTPLTPIRTQAYILRELWAEGHNGSDFVQSLDILERSVERLRRLIDETLDSARVQEGRLRIVRRDADISSLVHEAAAAYRHLAQRAQVELTVDVPARLETNLDPDRFAQVLDNLLGNAIAHTGPNGAVTVSAHQEPDQTIVVVHDTGVGLDAEQMGRLFEPFTIVDPGVPRKGSSSGLGLFICKGIVEAHGGRIWCESPGQDQGCTFFVAVPKVVVQTDNKAVAAMGVVREVSKR